MRSSSPIPTALAALALIAGPVSAFQLPELIKLTALDGAPGDQFGSSVAVGGGIAVIGAWEDDDNGVNSGSAYVFDVTTGMELLKLTASDAAVYDYFGCSVALGGSIAVIGASEDQPGTGPGSAYVFDVTTGTELLKLTASDGEAKDDFGWSVALSGTTAVVGAVSDDDNGTNSGSAYVLDVTTGAEILKLTASDGAVSDHFGWSVAVSGTTAVVGAPYDDDGGAESGSAYVFDTTTGTELLKLTASDGAAGDAFGWSVAFSGTTAVVGARGDGDNGSLSGAAYAFDLTTGTELFKLTASDGGPGDQFGSSVAVSGFTAVVGARLDDDSGLDSGSAYAFDLTTGMELVRLTASDGAAGDDAGWSVAVSGTTAVVGARLDDDNGSDSGSAYAFDLTTNPVAYYCTAGTSASSCQASIFGWGVASAAANSGFLMSASNAEGAKDGLFFFGTNGRQASPWGNGTSFQCVVPPVKRAGLMIAVGSTAGACDGSFALDLNALWCPACPKPLHNPGAGATVQAQLWCRDPWNTSNQTTSLSDAIEFTVGP